MSVFIGKYSDGKTVLSLRNGGGGGEDVWYHHDPQLDSLFHSDMPHMFIEEVYSANTWHAGDGFFITPMPAQVTDNLTNHPDRVIMQIITLRSPEGDEYRTITNGCSINWTAAMEGTGVIQGGGAAGYNTITAGLLETSFNQSSDVTLDVGYFWYDTSVSFKTMLANGSSRRIFWRMETAKQDRTNGGNVPPVPMAPEYWYMAGYMFYGGGDVPGFSGTVGTGIAWQPTRPNVIRNFHVDWWRPATPRRTGYNAIYVRMGMPRMGVGTYQKNWVPEGGGWLVNESGNANAGPRGGAWTCQSWFGNPIDFAWGQFGAKEIRDQIQWYWTPTKIEWYLTNFWWNGNDGYAVNNIFTGNDILISKDNFTVKGQNLMQVGRKMVLSTDAGESARNWRDEHIGCNVYKWDLNSNPINFLGGLPIAMGKKGWTGMAGPDAATTSSFGPASLAIHQFTPGKEWYLDSTVPAIGNQDGPIWSPSSVPLKNFEWNKSSFWLGGQSVWSNQNNMSWLAEADIGFSSSRAGAGLVLVQFHDLPSFMSSGGYGGFNGLRAIGNMAPEDATWLNVIGNMGDRPQRFFNVMIIPVNCHVPIFTVRNGVTCNQNSIGPYPYIRDGNGNGMYGQILYYSMTLWIHNNGDGKVSLWVSVSRNDAANNAAPVKFRIPGMFIHVQKLN